MNKPRAAGRLQLLWRFPAQMRNILHLFTVRREQNNLEFLLVMRFPIKALDPAILKISSPLPLETGMFRNQLKIRTNLWQTIFASLQNFSFASFVSTNELGANFLLLSTFQSLLIKWLFKFLYIICFAKLIYFALLKLIIINYRADSDT